MKLQWLMTGFVMVVMAMMSSTIHAAEVSIVTDGQARAVVVLADRPTATSRYAADELVRHIERATGAILPVVRESEIPEGSSTRIYLGETRALAAQGIQTAALRGDVFVFRVQDGQVYIAGREDALADPLDEVDNWHSGTLFGVYELLERFAGVRWLWPGELGTYVPRVASLSLPSLDEVVEPELSGRKYRWRRIAGAMSHHDPRPAELKDLPPQLRLTFSGQGVRAYGQDLNIYMRRHRLGHSDPARRQMRFNHYFGTWWKKYGKDHPDWFSMREDGQRGPARRHNTTMNVANPELHRFLVDKIWDGGDYIELGEADVGDSDQSPESRAWDGPQPRPTGEPNSYKLPQPYVTSDRYARFWKTIHEMASAKNPNVVITTILYVTYFPAPLMDIKLSDRIVGKFVAWRTGWGYSWDMWFPEPEDRMDWFRDQWTLWHDTGMSLELRPNTPLAGYVLPRVDTWQGGEFFQFAHRNGMNGADYTSLTGQWAVRGIEEYMYFRLFSNPKLPIATIRQEFLEAFGPAATDVGAYFDHWEQYQYNLREQGKWRSSWTRTGTYPQVDFIEAQAILDDAMAAVQGMEDAQYRQRVAFLQAGLHHARLTSRFLDQLQLAIDNQGKVADDALALRAWASLNELAQFRHATEGQNLSDYLWLEAIESRHAQKIKALISHMGSVPSNP